MGVARVQTPIPRPLQPRIFSPLPARPTARFNAGMYARIGRHTQKNSGTLCGAKKHFVPMRPPLPMPDSGAKTGKFYGGRLCVGAGTCVRGVAWVQCICWRHFMHRPAGAVALVLTASPGPLVPALPAHCTSFPEIPTRKLYRKKIPEIPGKVPDVPGTGRALRADVPCFPVKSYEKIVQKKDPGKRP
jgi:hypothetical protein